MIPSMGVIADVMYPALCVGCSRPVRGGLCRECFNAAPRLDPPYCNTCGAPSDRAQCRECRGQDFAFDRALQAFEFKGVVRSAIHRVKYRGERELAHTLMLSLEGLAQDFGGLPVTWIPSSTRRISERGFDHGRLLAEALAEKYSVHPIALLEKVKETPPQVSLSPQQRRTAQFGSMRCRIPGPPKVILIDDVFTTGATLSEAARAARESGTEKVIAVCIARSLLP